jgi:hypothetical protein
LNRPFLAVIHRVDLHGTRGDGAMTFDIGMPMVPELALFVLAVLVLFIGLVRQGDSASSRLVGWVTLASAWVRGQTPLGHRHAARGGQRLRRAVGINEITRVD